MLDGASREEAAKVGGMDRQTLRDWVIRFNERGPDGLINIPSPGVPPISANLPNWVLIATFSRRLTEMTLNALRGGS